MEFEKRHHFGTTDAIVTHASICDPEGDLLSNKLLLKKAEEVSTGVVGEGRVPVEGTPALLCVSFGHGTYRSRIIFVDEAVSPDRNLQK